ncbi:MAG: hypothetical protein ACPG4T_04920 [Nannocystaceae bacterium]
MITTRQMLLTFVFLLLGCDKPADNTAVPAGAPAGAVGTPASPAGSQEVAGTPSPGATSAPGAVAGGEPASPTAAPAAEACSVQLDALPTSFFTHRMILSLPRGLKLTEQNPYFARADSNNQTASCGGVVSFAALGYLRAPGSGGDLRNQILALRGLPEGSYTWEQGGSGRGFDGVYNAPKGPNGEPEIKGWMHTEDLNGVLFFVLYETDPGSWATLEPSFRASTAELRVKPVR